MKKKAFFSLLILLISFNIFATSIQINYDVPLDYEKNISVSVKEALDFILPSYIDVDDNLDDILTLDVKTEESVDDILQLRFDTQYKERKLSFNISLNKDKKIDIPILTDRLINAYKYDISTLFEKKLSNVINYATPNLVSFNFNEENKPKKSQYYYVRDCEDQVVAVANVNSLFNDSATLNIISNTKIAPNLRLTAGPVGLLSTSIGYQYKYQAIAGSLSYTFYNSFIPFLVNANVIIECGGFYNSILTQYGGYIDAGLSYELPLSLLFNNEGFFKNSNLRATVLLGASYVDEIAINSKYTIGYGIYLSNKSNIELYYESNTIFEKLEAPTFLLGLRFSVLL